MHTKAEIKNMSNSQLLRAYCWNIVNQVKEENFSRGVTKKTEKEHNYLKEEMIIRFDLREDFEDIEWKEGE